MARCVHRGKSASNHFRVFADASGYITSTLLETADDDGLLPSPHTRLMYVEGRRPTFCVRYRSKPCWKQTYPEAGGSTRSLLPDSARRRQRGWFVHHIPCRSRRSLRASTFQGRELRYCQSCLFPISRWFRQGARSRAIPIFTITVCHQQGSFGDTISVANYWTELTAIGHRGQVE